LEDDCCSANADKSGSEDLSPTATARARRAAQHELEVKLEVEQFLDDWHYTAVNTGLAKSWDRRRVLQVALDLLELNGVAFAPNTKEKCLLSVDLEATVDCIVEHMPAEVRTNFPHTAQQLQGVLLQIAVARRALEVGEDEGLQGVVEEDDELGLSRKILRNTVVHASEEVSKTIDTHASWRQRTEDRIARLQRAAEDAERATQQLMATETQLAQFGHMQSSKTRAALLGMASGQDKAVLHTAFSGWAGVMLKAQAEKEIRQKFQAQLSSVESKLFKLKERRTASARAALVRKAMESGDFLMRECFAAWLELHEDAKRDGITKEAVEEARKRLEAADMERKANMRKVVARMCDESLMGVLQTGFSAWQLALEDIKRDRELEGEFQKMEAQVKEALAAQKWASARIFESMGASSEAGLLSLGFAAWVQAAEEEKRTREMEAALGSAGKKLNWLQDRQMVHAMKVQDRINLQIELFLCMRVLNTWLLATKAERVQRHFNQKLENKRKQLNGVQSLFKTFAAQLEQGLASVEDDQDTTRIPIGGKVQAKPGERHSNPKHSHRDHRLPKRSSRGESNRAGMHKGSEGSVSLPDIRKPQMREDSGRSYESGRGRHKPPELHAMAT